MRQGGRANKHGEDNRTGDQACLTRAFARLGIVWVLASFMRDAAPSGGEMQHGSKKKRRREMGKKGGQRKDGRRSRAER